MDLNQRPLAYQASTLPLSYKPILNIFTEQIQYKDIHVTTHKTYIYSISKCNVYYSLDNTYHENHKKIHIMRCNTSHLKSYYTCGKHNAISTNMEQVYA